MKIYKVRMFSCWSKDQYGRNNLLLLTAVIGRPPRPCLSFVQQDATVGPFHPGYRLFSPVGLPSPFLVF